MSEVARTPRVIVELIENDASGETMVAVEQYINGSRRRTVCHAAQAQRVIMDCLADQKAEIKAEIKRKADARAAEERARHARVYNNTAFGHGYAFADRYVGKPERASGKPKTPATHGVGLDYADLA